MMKYFLIIKKNICFIFQQKEKIKETSKLTLDSNVLDFRLGKKNNDLPPFTEKKHKSLREGKYR